MAPENVDDSEELSRYIFQSGQYSTTKIKYVSLLPKYSEHNDRFETSVFRSSFMASNDEIWAIGDKFAGLDRRRVKARGILIAESVREETLDVIPETSSHDLHADIIDWPAEKSEQMVVAKELARQAGLEIRAQP